MSPTAVLPTAMRELPFTDLLQQARGGDPEAMGQLAARYEPQVRRVARRRLGPALRGRVDSMDLVHAVHLTLIRRLKDNQFVLRRPEDLVGLAVKMVIRKVARCCRRARREEEFLRL